MKMHLLIRRFAGAFILVSLLLAHYHSPYWLWFTAFVGFNLLQSSFTNFCPLEMILKKLGVGREGEVAVRPARNNLRREMNSQRTVAADWSAGGSPASFGLYFARTSVRAPFQNETATGFAWDIVPGSLASAANRGRWSALDYAVAHNPDARLAQQRINAAQAGLEQADSAFWPQLQVQSSYTRTDNPMMAFGTSSTTRVRRQRGVRSSSTPRCG